MSANSKPGMLNSLTSAAKAVTGAASNVVGSAVESAQAVTSAATDTVTSVATGAATGANNNATMGQQKTWGKNQLVSARGGSRKSVLKRGIHAYKLALKKTQKMSKRMRSVLTKRLSKMRKTRR